MRLSRWLSVLLLTVSAAIAQAASPPDRPDLANASAALEQTYGWSQTDRGSFYKDVSGFGFTREDAEQDAMEKARSELIFFMKRQKAAMVWEPALEYLRQQGMIRSLNDEGTPPPPGKPQEARLRLEVTPEVFRDIIRQDMGELTELNRMEHQRLTQERHLLWGKILTGTLVLLLITTGYCRLDELTRGYYTTRLRAAALVCVGLVGLLWWLIL